MLSSHRLEMGHGTLQVRVCHMSDAKDSLALLGLLVEDHSVVLGTSKHCLETLDVCIRLSQLRLLLIDDTLLSFDARCHHSTDGLGIADLIQFGPQSLQDGL